MDRLNIVDGKVGTRNVSNKYCFVRLICFAYLVEKGNLMVAAKINWAVKTLVFLFITGSIISGFSNVAKAYCTEPSAPYYKPEKPLVPWCVNEYAGTHTCDEWEIDNYYDSINNYKTEVDDYIAQLNAYIDEAVEYAQCEVANLE